MASGQPLRGIWESEQSLRGLRDDGAVVCARARLAGGTEQCRFVVIDNLYRGSVPREKTLLTVMSITLLVACGIAHSSLVPLGVAAMIAVFLFRYCSAAGFFAAQSTAAIQSDVEKP